MNPNDFTNINFLGAAIISICCLFILTFPRRYAVLPIIAGLIYIGIGQVVNVFGIHFTSMRILIFAGWIRVFIKKEIRGLLLNSIDKSVIIFVVISFLAYCMLWRTQQALVYRLGIVYNVFGLYFLYRLLILDVNDVINIIRIMAIAIIPLAMFMILEKTTGKNIFYYFGSVPENTIIREGKLRCQGPFSHPILAGTFGVTITPIFIGLWFNSRKDKIFSAIGIVSSTMITFLCASSGPALSYIAIILGIILWRYNNHMKKVRWFLFLSVIGLHMIMKAPVWNLISRIGEVVGGTGYHRSMLIDSAIKYFGEWWLIGTTYTAHWLPYVMPDDPNNVDLTNEFILIGVEGGLISIILFISILKICFSAVGKTVRSLDEKSLSMSKFIWYLGVSLSTYLVSFISVAMFNFMVVYFYFVISLIAIVTISISNEHIAEIN